MGWPTGLSVHTEGHAITGLRSNLDGRSVVSALRMADVSSLSAPGVLLVTPWYGGTSNGVALVVECVAQSLHEAGVSVVVLEMVGDGWFPQIRRGASGEEVLSVCVRDLETAHTVRRRLAARVRGAMAACAIRWLIHRRALRIAHFHYCFPEYDVVRRIVQRARLPIIATFHGSDLGVNLDDPRARSATERLLRAATVVTTVSDSLRGRLVEMFPFTAPIARTVHNAVPVGFLRSAGTRNSPQDIDVLFAGNLITRKGVDVLLRALAAMREQGLALQAMIVGHGTERASLELLAAELGLTDAVRFVGRQERDVLVTLFQRARVAVVPSRAEPFGLVLVEAMVCGAAVVASDVGGIPEIAAKTGGVALVPPEDPAELARAIALLLNDPARRDRVAREAQSRALRAFAPSTMCNAYASAYRSALDMDDTHTPG